MKTTTRIEPRDLRANADMCVEAWRAAVAAREVAHGEMLSARARADERGSRSFSEPLAIALARAKVELAEAEAAEWTAEGMARDALAIAEEAEGDGLALAASRARLSIDLEPMFLREDELRAALHEAEKRRVERVKATRDAVVALKARRLAGNEPHPRGIASESFVHGDAWRRQFLEGLRAAPPGLPESFAEKLRTARRELRDLLADAERAERAREAAREEEEAEARKRAEAERVEAERTARADAKLFAERARQEQEREELAAAYAARQAAERAS